MKMRTLIAIAALPCLIAASEARADWTKDRNQAGTITAYKSPPTTVASVRLSSAGEVSVAFFDSTGPMACNNNNNKFVPLGGSAEAIGRMMTLLLHARAHKENLLVTILNKDNACSLFSVEISQ